MLAGCLVRIRKQGRTVEATRTRGGLKEKEYGVGLFTPHSCLM